MRWERWSKSATYRGRVGPDNRVNVLEHDDRARAYPIEPFLVEGSNGPSTSPMLAPTCCARSLRAGDWLA